ncbi:MAG: DNA primase [Clostridia bacterium]|nr:DNA primase [Clostridia bacterium]
MIPRQVVDEILSRNDIESLVSSYVSLKRAGSNLKGLCPFHSEKSPSFTVFPSDNSFYCFGCGIGGNAITFIRQIEHLDYPDAVKFLAKRAGIQVIDDGRDDGYERGAVSKERMLAMNVEAAKYFHRALFADTPKAREALAYLTEKRRLSPATIRHFGLGYAPDSYHEFTDYMRARGYSYEELVAGFLSGKNDRGRYYDAFRNRVMFPIIDVSGNVIAFGGRVMDDSKPKYKNSSDTPVFKKLRNLFALNFARQTCAETMILCEGYMDVIALHAAGFTNAVATLGTAITSDQARLMSRYTKKVIICYDSDEAGQKAAVRALRMLGDVGLEVNVLKLPGAKDPDEYIKDKGRDAFAHLLTVSKTKFEYNMDSVLSKYDLAVAQDRIQAVTELVKFIAEFHSSSERDVYIKAVSEKTGIQAASIRTDVEATMRRNQAARRRNEGQLVRQTTAGVFDKVNTDYSKAPSTAKKEETVLGLLLLFPAHRKRVFDGALLSEDDFFTDFGKRVFAFLKEEYGAEDRPEASFDRVFTSEEVGRITKLKLSRMSLTENGDEVLGDAIEDLKRAQRKQASGQAGTYAELDQLLASMRQSKT